MNTDDLISKGYIVSTGKGCKANIQVRVYGAGFGQIIMRREQTPIAPLELMFNNADEATACFREIWDCVGQAAQRAPISDREVAQP